MKLIDVLLRRLFRLSLSSIFLCLVLFFIVFTFVTYIYLNGNIGLKPMSPIKAITQTEVFNIFDELSTRLPRIHSYCNPFPSISMKDETDPNLSSKLSLQKVFILIRHGDRGPLRPVRNQSSIICDPFVTEANSFHSLMDRFFIAVKDRLKHTLRDKRISSLMNTGSLESGQLSRLGVAQHLALGSLVGQTYRNKLAINYTNFKVYSTPYTRTFQSAVAFVYGFLLPKSLIDFKRFPQITATYGTYFCTSAEFCVKQCPKMNDLHKQLNDHKRQVLSSHSAVIQLMNELKIIVANHQNETHLFDSPIALFDGLMAYLCHNTALPCLNDRCIALEEVKKLISFIEFNGKHLVVSNVFRHLNWLKIYGFLNHLIELIDNKESTTKLILFSGHDITIVALASALDFFDGAIPPYASRVIFETYLDTTEDNNNNNLFLRIIYNGKDITRFTEICRQNPTICLFSDSKQTNYLIPFNEFRDFIRKKFKFFTQTNDYQKACDLN